MNSWLSVVKEPLLESLFVQILPLFPGMRSTAIWAGCGCNLQAGINQLASAGAIVVGLLNYNAAGRIRFWLPAIGANGTIGKAATGGRSSLRRVQNFPRR